MKKLFLCMVSAFIVAVSSLNVYADGLKIENGETVVIKENPVEIEVSVSGNIEEAEEIAAVPFSVALGDEWTADTSDTKEYYYDQLSDDVCKYVYDYLNENADDILEGDGEVTIQLPESLYKILATDDIDSFLGNDLYYAIQMYFNFDHGEKFGYYFNKMSFGYDENYTDEANSTNVITEITLYFGCNLFYDDDGEIIDYTTSTLLGYDTSDEVIADQKIMETKVQEILDSIPENASRKKKLEIINDWLVDNNTYNPYIAEGNDDKASMIAYMSSSALIYNNGSDDTKYPVCEGYSEAFKYLCDRVDIPCVSVTSSTHKWNEVQMEDGNWYAVDVTWNDPVGTLTSEQVDAHRYDFFLIGSTTLEATDDEYGSHELYSFVGDDVKVPTLNEADYVYAPNGNINNDDLIDYKDVSIMLKAVVGKTTLTDDEIALGDINNDGVITLADAILTSQAIGN